MERSDFLTRLVGAVIFLAIAVYIGIYIYQSQADPFQTTVATSCEVNDSISIEGYIVRSEEAVTGSSRAVILADDGRTVAKGETVAVEYSDSAAMEVAARIREIEIELKQAEKSDSSAGTDAVLEMSQAVNGRSFSSLYTTSLAVRTSIVDEISLSDSDVESLNRELESLQASLSGSTDVITAPASGVFTSVSDGFESVTYDDILDATPSKLASLFSGASGTSENIGKMVYGVYWYYAAAIDSTEASYLTVGGKAKLSFEAYGITATMRVESIGIEENGKKVVIFSCSRYLTDFTDLRETEAKLITEDYSGLRVPKKAIRLDDDDSSVTYVYIVSGVQARRVDVEILGEISDSYVVSTGGELREGAEIIIKANDLYDGKVVGS